MKVKSRDEALAVQTDLMPLNLYALLPATQSSYVFCVETGWDGDSGRAQGRERGEDVWKVAEEQGSEKELLEQKVKCQMFGCSTRSAAQNTKVTIASSSTQPHCADK